MTFPWVIKERSSNTRKTDDLTMGIKERSRDTKPTDDLTMGYKRYDQEIQDQQPTFPWDIKEQSRDTRQTEDLPMGYKGTIKRYETDRRPSHGV